MRVKAITNIEFQVQDLDASVEFFTKTLGFYLQRRTHRGGRLSDVGNARERGEHVFVGLGETWVELMPPPNGIPQETPYEERPRPNYVFAVEVEDLDGAIRELAALGVGTGTILEHPQSYWGRQVTVFMERLGQPIVLREFRAPDNARFMDWHPDETNR